MSSSGGGSGIQMNVGELTSLASNVNDLANALGTMQQYAGGDQISADAFGQVEVAQTAAGAFIGVLKDLATSIGKAQTFAEGAHSALLQATKATSATDEQAAQALMNAGPGASS